jgi:c-di-GMP-binding flagellar brake protein YcgR
MEIKNIVTEGNRVEVRLISSTDEIAKIPGVSAVADLTKDDGQVVIDMPKLDGKWQVLEVNARLIATFFGKDGQYYCKCVVTDRYKWFDKVVAVLSPLTDLVKIQRREALRIDCNIKIQHRVLSNEELTDMSAIKSDALSNNDKMMDYLMKMEQYDAMYRPGDLIDLSNGGGKLVCESAYGKDERLMLKIPLDMPNGEHKIIELSAIVRSAGGLMEGSPMNLYGFDFDDTFKESISNISSYILFVEKTAAKKAMLRGKGK